MYVDILLLGDTTNQILILFNNLIKHGTTNNIDSNNFEDSYILRKDEYIENRIILVIQAEIQNIFLMG